ncbi:glycosyltransferase family 2 protein [Flavobacteriales bacterium]|jgi:cellulose synthase/poly-beta-1,6-N-acetylglucosamine synthase-like glycosyltransferase|nr:glycosyltransferase family 2 protein [Flavobacteriales bacterium]
MTCTLIIATYNWPQALELVLISVSKQTIIPDEIVIADDGSTKETLDVIKKVKKKLNLPIKHVWQEDQGFRKTKILNKSFAIAKGEYIVQVDGDIVLHKKFVEDHLGNARPNVFLHGSRSFLNNRLSQKSIHEKITSFNFFEKGLTNRWNAIYFKPLAMFARPNKSLKKTRGCNFSCFKKDFLLVNGYNEDMIGWGKEDTELSARLINNNILKKQLKNCALSYHLEHQTFERKGLNKNIKILENTILKKEKYCENGVAKYIS